MTGSSRPEVVGLCLTCGHGRRVQSAKGATFFFCGLSARDPAYPRYPRLPVSSCPGYVAAGKATGPEPPAPGTSTA